MKEVPYVKHAQCVDENMRKGGCSKFTLKNARRGIVSIL